VSFAFAGLHQLLLPFLDARDRLPDPQRRAIETAFGLADGDSPDPFLVGLPELHVDGLDDASSRALLTLTSPDLRSELMARILDEAVGERPRPAIARRDGWGCSRRRSCIRRGPR
jgi:hypothetical protein